MTIQQTRKAKRRTTAQVPLKRSCAVATQALCRGALDWRVQGVTGAAAREGEAHIALRYGRILLYLEDRDALEALVDAVEAAYELREPVFGGDDVNSIPVRQAQFERDGKPSIARLA